MYIYMHPHILGISLHLPSSLSISFEWFWVSEELDRDGASIFSRDRTNRMSCGQISNQSSDLASDATVVTLRILGN